METDVGREHTGMTGSEPGPVESDVWIDIDLPDTWPSDTRTFVARCVETLPDLSSVSPLFDRVQEISRAMETVLGAAGSFVAMNNRVSQSVPHLHVHVVPRNRKDGLRGFFWPRTSYEDDDDAAAHAARLRSWLEAG